MKKYFTLIIACILCTNIFSQTPAKYWIQFKDKANSPYSISRPEEFLSPRAIDLRLKHRIAIDERDLPVNEHYIKEVLALDNHMKVLTRSKWLNGITIYSEKENILSAIQRLDCVTFAERTISLDSSETDLDTIYQYTSSAQPTHTYLSDIIKNLDFAYGNSEEQLRMTNIHWLHRLGFRGENVRLMVLDGGFSRADSLCFFNNLRNDHRLISVRNLVQYGKSPFQTGTHGTTVLSCIASYSPNKIVGCAPFVEICLAQTEDGRTEHKVEEDNWVAGIELADSLGCQVLSSSLGYTKFDDSTQTRTYSDITGKVSRASQAATIASSKGMIICNSAGNEAMSNIRHIGCPADADGILTVGAVTIKKKRAIFSSFGPTADGRLKPDVCALGQMTAVGGLNGNPTVASGTSFSSPLVAGMAACLWQAFPDKSNVEIMNAIRLSGSQADQPDTLMGYGIPDFLRAYNMLSQPSTSLSHIIFNSYIAQQDTLYITIANEKAVEDLVKRCLVNISTQKKAQVKVIENGSRPNEDGSTNYLYKIVLPKFTKRHAYKLTKLEINHFGERTYYIVGQENK